MTGTGSIGRVRPAVVLGLLAVAAVALGGISWARQDSTSCDPAYQAFSEARSAAAADVLDFSVEASGTAVGPGTVSAGGKLAPASDSFAFNLGGGNGAVSFRGNDAYERAGPGEWTESESAEVQAAVGDALVEPLASLDPRVIYAGIAGIGPEDLVDDCSYDLPPDATGYSVDEQEVPLGTTAPVLDGRLYGLSVSSDGSIGASFALDEGMDVIFRYGPSPSDDPADIPPG